MAVSNKIGPAWETTAGVNILDGAVLRTPVVCYPARLSAS